MDEYRIPRTPRNSVPAPNPLTDFQPSMVAWTDLEDYFRETRERIISDMTRADTERALWQAQGKLTLVDELARLRVILQALAAQGKE
jgi:hypothetical protein